MFKVCVIATLAIAATLAEAGLIAGPGLAIGGYGGAYDGHGVDYYVSRLIFANFIIIHY